MKENRWLHCNIGFPVGLASNHVDAAIFSDKSACSKIFETGISKHNLDDFNAC
jgi:hypothetical protein